MFIIQLLFLLIVMMIYYTCIYETFFNKQENKDDEYKKYKSLKVGFYNPLLVDYKNLNNLKRIEYLIKNFKKNNYNFDVLFIDNVNDDLFNSFLSEQYDYNLLLNDNLRVYSKYPFLDDKLKIKLNDKIINFSLYMNEDTYNLIDDDENEYKINLIFSDKLLFNILKSTESNIPNYESEIKSVNDDFSKFNKYENFNNNLMILSGKNHKKFDFEKHYNLNPSIKKYKIPQVYSQHKITKRFIFSKVDMDVSSLSLYKLNVFEGFF